MSKINRLIKLYTTSMPFVTIYSTCLGIDTGIQINKILYENNNTVEMEIPKMACKTKSNLL